MPVYADRRSTPIAAHTDEREVVAEKLTEEAPAASPTSRLRFDVGTVARCVRLYDEISSDPVPEIAFAANACATIRSTADGTDSDMPVPLLAEFVTGVPKLPTFLYDTTTAEAPGPKPPAQVAVTVCGPLGGFNMPNSANVCAVPIATVPSRVIACPP